MAAAVEVIFTQRAGVAEVSRDALAHPNIYKAALLATAASGRLWLTVAYRWQSIDRSIQ